MLRIVLVIMMAACTTGQSGAIDACTAHDYDACTTDDGKDGWCVPHAGCLEVCSEVSNACWNFTYAWPGDPEMERAPICWCSDDS